MRALLRGSSAARCGLGATIVIGLLLHPGMDALNVYGVHPFAPFDTHWYYGDMVFIVEPLFWLALGTPLAAQVAHAGWRRLLLGLLLAAPVLFTVFGFLQPGSLLGLALVWALSQWLTRRAGERAALIAGVALCFGFVLLQGTLAGLARDQLSAALRRDDASVHILDLPLSAFPTNPLCWGTVAVTRDDLGGYRLRRGVLSLAPRWVAPSACPAKIAGVYVSAGAADVPQGIAWAVETHGSVAGLRVLRERDCRIDALAALCAGASAHQR
ncbi:metal-dependent hydrolase [Massilia sp. Dwa41.01b]|uniref:metal-dependent hydrolase n=1 Tax=Massilia sp. Dwa41.01b TaxID=2709302 RepID=UPI001E316227|nr:metal-dependent hydrolase [Massilia sp. Dwa41.01b]